MLLADISSAFVMVASACLTEVVGSRTSDVFLDPCIRYEIEAVLRDRLFIDWTAEPIRLCIDSSLGNNNNDAF